MLASLAIPSTRRMAARLEMPHGSFLLSVALGLGMLYYLALGAWQASPASQDRLQAAIGACPELRQTLKTRIESGTVLSVQAVENLKQLCLQHQAVAAAK